MYSQPFLIPEYKEGKKALKNWDTLPKKEKQRVVEHYSDENIKKRSTDKVKYIYASTAREMLDSINFPAPSVEERIPEMKNAGEEERKAMEECRKKFQNIR